MNGHGLVKKEAYVVLCEDGTYIWEWRIQGSDAEWNDSTDVADVLTFLTNNLP